MSCVLPNHHWHFVPSELGPHEKGSSNSIHLLLTWGILMAGSWPISTNLRFLREHRISKKAESLHNGFACRRSNPLMTLPVSDHLKHCLPCPKPSQRAGPRLSQRRVDSSIKSSSKSESLSDSSEAGNKEEANWGPPFNEVALNHFYMDKKRVNTRKVPLVFSK